MKPLSFSSSVSRDLLLLPAPRAGPVGQGGAGRGCGPVLLLSAPQLTCPTLDSAVVKVGVGEEKMWGEERGGASTVVMWLGRVLALWGQADKSEVPAESAGAEPPLS